VGTAQPIHEVHLGGDHGIDATRSKQELEVRPGRVPEPDRRRDHSSHRFLAVRRAEDLAERPEQPRGLLQVVDDRDQEAALGPELVVDRLHRYAGMACDGHHRKRRARPRDELARRDDDPPPGVGRAVGAGLLDVGPGCAHRS